MTWFPDIIRCLFAWNRNFQIVTSLCSQIVASGCLFSLATPGTNYLENKSDFVNFGELSLVYVFFLLWDMWAVRAKVLQHHISRGMSGAFAKSFGEQKPEAAGEIFAAWMRYWGENWCFLAVRQTRYLSYILFHDIRVGACLVNQFRQLSHLLAHA